MGAGGGPGALGLACEVAAGAGAAGAVGVSAGPPVVPVELVTAGWFEGGAGGLKKYSQPASTARQSTVARSARNSMDISLGSLMSAPREKHSAYVAA